MIIHVYPDGSEGFQFEQGDTVHAQHATAGGWFSTCLQSVPFCTVVCVEKGPWRVAGLDLKTSPDWGTIRAAAWNCTPTAETLQKARRVQASTG